MDVIELIIKNLSLSIDKYDSASMAVPGGTSPIKIFDELSKQKLDWSKVQITLVDDRLVDSENDHSNQKLIRNHLLKNEAQISDFIPLNKNLHKDNNFKFPLDICLLGIGNDGHIASLFKNNISEKNKKFVDFIKRKDFYRITLTLKCLNNSKNIFLWAPKKNKISIVKKIIFDKKIFYPASFLKSKNKYLFYSN